MRIAAFAEKYGLPMSIVHQASFHTAARREADGYGYIDFPEEELFTAVRFSLEDKIKAAQGNVEKNRLRLARLSTCDGKNGSVEEMCERLKAFGL